MEPICTSQQASRDVGALSPWKRLLLPDPPLREYPLCAQDTALTAKQTVPCVGVVGGAQPSQRCGQSSDSFRKAASSKAASGTAAGCNEWAYGAASDIMDRLRSTPDGKDGDASCGTTPATLGSVDLVGACVPCDPSASVGASGGQPACVNGNGIATQSLVVNDVALGQAGKQAQNLTVPTYWTKDFPLQTLHKIWGDGGDNSVNNGVHSRNVYLSPQPETVQCTPTLQQTLGFATATQTVLVLEAHGGNYKGDSKGIKVPGILRGDKTDNTAALNGATMPKTQTFEETASPERVGGIVTSRKAYGPGVYNVLAYVSPTTDASSGGRGYVFAMWPFHYSEVYVGTDPANPPSQARGNLAGPNADPDFPCYGQCDDGTPDNPKCAGSCSGSESDLFDVINHEIDIEIPSNAPAASTPNDPSSGRSLPWAEKYTWDTMNVNTWVNDIGNYDMDTGAYYQNLGVKMQPPASSSFPQSFASTDGGYPSSFASTDGYWHWYTIDWHVDNADYRNNYVAVYFDDPFDPSGTTTHNGVKLPLKAQGAPLAKTQRFVPTRFGRLNVGPWFGWWGYDKNKGPQFDTAYVGVAHISVIPQSPVSAQKTPQSGFLFPQSYDQSYVDKDSQIQTIAGDFQDFFSQGPVPQPITPIFPVRPTPPPPPPSPPSPSPSPSPSAALSPAAIVLITIGCLILLAAAIAAAVVVSKHKKQARVQ